MDRSRVGCLVDNARQDVLADTLNILKNTNPSPEVFRMFDVTEVSGT